MRKDTQKYNFCERFGKWVILPVFFVLFGFDAIADDTSVGREIILKYQMVEELKKEIAQIDSETARCQKMKRGWIAATVVGGVGVVATGTAAIVQATKLKDAPKSEKKNETEKEPDAEDKKE